MDQQQVVTRPILIYGSDNSAAANQLIYLDSESRDIAYIIEITAVNDVDAIDIARGDPIRFVPNRYNMLRSFIGAGNFLGSSCKNNALTFVDVNVTPRWI